jgi:hypothetical protein
VSLSGEAPPPTTLRTERLGDGQANCLEQASRLAGPGDSVVLCNDRTDASGHAVVLHPDGSVSDPNQPGVRYPDLGSWQASHPQYQEAGRVPAKDLKQVLSQPPGAQREAEIRRLGLQGVAGVAVADDVDDTAALIQQLEAYGVSVAAGDKEFRPEELRVLLTTVQDMGDRLNAAARPRVPEGDTTLFKELFGPLKFTREDTARSGYATNRGEARGDGVTYIEVGDGAFDSVGVTEGTIPTPRTGQYLTTQELLTHEIAHTLNYRLYANDPDRSGPEYIANWYGRTLPDGVAGGGGLGFQAGQKVGEDYTGPEQVTDAIANWFLGSFTSDATGRAARGQMNQLMGNLLAVAGEVDPRY